MDKFDLKKYLAEGRLLRENKKSVDLKAVASYFGMSWFDFSSKSNSKRKEFVELYKKQHPVNENQKINTNVYYVDEYQDFYHEAVPEYEIDDVEAMLSSNGKNHLYIKKGTKGQYEDGIFTTEEESDTRVSPEYIGEGEELKEGLFDRRKVINWLKSNHKYDMTNDPNADYDYELGDPDDGNRVRVEKDGIFVNIEGGISDKISFGEFKRQYIGEETI